MSVQPQETKSAWVERLYDEFGAALYRYAVMVLANQAAAEDAVHEVFARLLRSAQPVEFEDRYLWTSVRNECYSSLRRRRIQPTGDNADLLEVVTVDHDPSLRLALEQALKQLTPEQREVVHLKAFEGLTFNEIAMIVRSSTNTVASRYRYALERMRVILGHANE